MFFMKEQKLKKTFLFLYNVLIVILMSCTLSDEFQIISIQFIDDRTIEYEHTAVMGEKTGNYLVGNFTIVPDEDYRIVRQVGSTTKKKIYFNKDIPDGAIIKLDFYERNNSDKIFVLTYSFVKGE